MMGMHRKQTELWVEPVNLARRIPEDHILRKLKKSLDLSFVREEVSKTYGRNGNVSVDPVVVMKMMLLLFLDNVSSERELMRIIPLRIDYLWYLGYGLEDEIPNHSVLSKARRRWGADIFERLFKVTVAKCLKAGLIDGSKVHVDLSNIRANGSKNSIAEVACEEVLGRLDEASPETAQVPKEKGRGWVNRTKRSTTDPDATLVRQGNGQSEPSYKNHRVVDDKTGVVTALKSTTGSVHEAHELVELTEAHEANTGCAARVPGQRTALPPEFRSTPRDHRIHYTQGRVRQMLAALAMHAFPNRAHAKSALQAGDFGSGTPAEQQSGSRGRPQAAATFSGTQFCRCGQSPWVQAVPLAQTGKANDARQPGRCTPEPQTAGAVVRKG